MALTIEQQRIRKRIDDRLLEMPYYVGEYVRDKIDIQDFSVNTMLEYLYQFKDFFEWLVDFEVVEDDGKKRRIVKATKIKDISLADLDELKKNDVKLYFEMKKYENIASDTRKKHGVVVERKISSQNANKSALRSLFKYLQSETENNDGDTYIERNVMAKFPLKREAKTSNERAAELNRNILKDQEIPEFLRYVEYEYENTLESPQQLSRFKRDKLRDLAILHLLLGSGVRVAEASALEISELNLKAGTISVKRKGGKQDNIPIMIEAVLAIEHYLKIRDINYPGAQYCPFVFVAKKKPVSELSRRAIQNLVEKYTRAYTGNTKGLYPHKLRHSFALDYRKHNDDLLMLSEQLGHSNTNTTRLYVNRSDEERLIALEKVSRERNNEGDM